MYITEVVNFAHNRLTRLKYSCAYSIHDNLHLHISANSPLTVVHDIGPYVGTELLEAIALS